MNTRRGREAFRDPDGEDERESAHRGGGRRERPREEEKADPRDVVRGGM